MTDRKAQRRAQSETCKPHGCNLCSESDSSFFTEAITQHDVLHFNACSELGGFACLSGPEHVSCQLRSLHTDSQTRDLAPKANVLRGHQPSQRAGGEACHWGGGTFHRGGASLGWLTLVLTWLISGGGGIYWGGGKHWSSRITVCSNTTSRLFQRQRSDKKQHAGLSPNVLVVSVLSALTTPLTYAAHPMVCHSLVSASKDLWCQLSAAAEQETRNTESHNLTFVSNFGPGFCLWLLSVLRTDQHGSGRLLCNYTGCSAWIILQ